MINVSISILLFACPLSYPIPVGPALCLDAIVITRQLNVHHYSYNTGTSNIRGGFELDLNRACFLQKEKGQLPFDSQYLDSDANFLLYALFYLFY